MKSSTNHGPVSALHEILKWSGTRPEWQRDALRRIVVNGTIDDADLKELDRLCRAKHKADCGDEPISNLEALDSSHLPPAPGSESSVTLVSIGNLQNVNRLASDQVLTFGTWPGLTVIYGDSGSGKSGYARVIKKACRTRGSPPVIRPNVFAAGAKGPAAGEIRIVGVDKPISWMDGVVPDARLGNIFVFDASTAGHYLEEDGPTTFTPQGLDVLPKLSKVCDLIKDRIQQTINRTKADIEATAKNWKYEPKTKVGALVSSLSSKTVSADIETLVGLDEKQIQRLQDIKAALSSDAKQKAVATRASAERLRTFSSAVADAAKGLSDENGSSLSKMIEGAKTTAEAAKSFASGQFESGFLAGTGGDLWRTLWEAAKAYSTSAAYSGQQFPLTEDEAKCVLCQQILDSEAALRLRAFDKFCRDQSQQLAEQAAQQLEKASHKIGEMQTLAPEATRVESDLAVATEEQRNAIAEFVKASETRLTTVKDSLAKLSWSDSTTLPPSPADVIAGLVTFLEERATMEESADDPIARAKLKSEQDELAMRMWLADVKADVLEQIKRYKRVAVLETCQNDTVTGQITNKNTDLTKLLVTVAYCKRFEEEVNALGLRTLAVKLEEIRGKKGETRFGLRLVASESNKVKEIASEGEQRCIALAAFLAELSQASHQSALVFDDPVSSLDQWHGEKIAIRLVEESKDRQVIVFTHDAVFLNDLKTWADNEKVTPTFRFLEWNGDIPGQCHDGLPWDWQSADDRFDKLEKEQRAIAKNWSSIPNEENVRSMRQAYSRLRATLERIVEKEIFADVVIRFRSYVDVKKLTGVVGFSATECTEIQRLVQRCHNVTDAHDPPSGKHAMVPEPTDLAKDIADAKQLVTEIRARRKAATAG